MATCGWGGAVGSLSADFFNGDGAQLLQTLNFVQTSSIYFAPVSYSDPDGLFTLTGDVIANRATDQINYSFHADGVEQQIGFVLDFSIPLDGTIFSNVMYSEITGNGTAGGDAFTASAYNASNFLVTASGSTSESLPTGLDNGTACTIPATGSNTCDYPVVFDALSAAPNNPLNVEVAFVVPVDSSSDPNDFGVDGSIGFGTPEPSTFLMLSPALLLLRRRVS